MTTGVMHVSAADDHHCIATTATAFFVCRQTQLPSYMMLFAAKRSYPQAQRRFLFLETTSSSTALLSNRRKLCNRQTASSMGLYTPVEYLVFGCGRVRA